MVRSVALEHTEIEPSDLTLHHGCGVELQEYQDQEEVFDLAQSDPHFFETYGNDPRDLCTVKDVDGYIANDHLYDQSEETDQTQQFQDKEFHPIVMKVGSARRGETGLIDIATELEIIARGLGLYFTTRSSMYWTLSGECSMSQDALTTDTQSRSMKLVWCGSSIDSAKLFLTSFITTEANSLLSIPSRISWLQYSPLSYPRSM